ncbi:hypothetical protein D9M68_866210 [compost metagenome]
MAVGPFNLTDQFYACCPDGLYDRCLFRYTGTLDNQIGIQDQVLRMSSRFVSDVMRLQLGPVAILYLAEVRDEHLMPLLLSQDCCAVSALACS